MKNLLFSSTNWIVPCLILTNCLFTQPSPRLEKSFEIGKEVVRAQMKPGYNAPANIEVRGSWDLDLDASFLYWQVMQDNMEIAFASNTPAASIPTISSTSGSLQGSFIEPGFKYKPGAQIGLTLRSDHDNWDMSTQYTWLEGSIVDTSNGPLGGTLLPTWGHPMVVNNNFYDTADQKWHYSFNLIDGDVGRTFYVGSALVVRSFFGARAGWILQKLQVTYTNLESTLYNGIPGTQNVSVYSNSWGVGPRMGLASNWNLGSDFCLFGNGSIDLLYTDYNIKSKTLFQRNAKDGDTAGQIKSMVSREAPRGLRTHLDLEMGISWGTYLHADSFYMLLAASYGFQVFWNQNPFRHFESANAMLALSSTPSGNLYAHGATGTIRFDF